MSLFVFSSWVLCLATSFLLLLVFFRHRYLLVKPSVWFVLFFHLRIQWASTIDAAYIETFLPSPWEFLWLSNIFPFIGLLVSALGWGQGACRTVWQRTAKEIAGSDQKSKIAIGVFSICIVVFVLYYFTKVLPESTGLFAILTSSTDATIAREESFKLVSDPLVRYGYAVVKGVFAPLLGVLIMIDVWKKSVGILLTRLIPRLAAVIALLVVVSLYGARSPAAVIIASIAIAFLWRRQLSVSPVYIGLAVVAILTLPTVFTILRERQELTFSTYWSYLGEGILNRIFRVPMQTGLFRVYHVQQFGFFGVRGEPNLAALFGVEPINVANLMANLYRSSRVTTGLMNTSYVFDYYGLFGLVSVLVSLALLWLLDIVLPIYSRVRDVRLLAACISVTVLSVTNFIDARYTSAFASNGFIISPLLILLIDNWVRSHPQFKRHYHDLIWR